MTPQGRPGPDTVVTAARGGDPGPLRAIVAALIVATLYAQGGALRLLSLAALAGLLLTPGPGGKSLLAAMLSAIAGYLNRR